jgi:hypothetical protein
MKADLSVSRVKVKIKVKSLCLTITPLRHNHAVNEHCHEDIWGSGSITPYTLNLGTRWRCVVCFVPQSLYNL